MISSGFSVLLVNHSTCSSEKNARLRGEVKSGPEPLKVPDLMEDMHFSRILGMMRVAGHALLMAHPLHVLNYSQHKAASRSKV